MKLKYIDVLRGLAILGVLVVHCGQYGHNEYYPNIVQSFINNGAKGVQLFYIASAFTLFLSMSKRSKIEKYPNTNFFIRRLFRIAPMYYITIFYYCWSGVSTGVLLSNIFFVHDLNPYWLENLVPGGWSVGVEMLFYCLIPFLFLKIKNSQQAFVFVLITLAISFIYELIVQSLPLNENTILWYGNRNYMLPMQLPIFALGILYYFILQEGYKLTLKPSLILIAAFILLADFNGIQILKDFFLFSIGFVILAIALSKYEFKILINPIFIHIGKVSFSMYLVHHAILFWLTKFGMIDYLNVTNKYSAVLNYGIRLVVLIGLSTLISTFFYQLVEVPMQKVGKKLITRINR